ILVLKKSKSTNDVLFIDASAEFTRSGNKNRLTDAHQQRILNTLIERAPVDHFAVVVPNADIAERDYLLSVSSYVQAEDTREVVDITALNAEIARIVARQAELRTAIDAIVSDLEGGAA
ncbi:MAG: N-6 DNA methylase, partial [Rhodoglobus sp.]